MNTTSLTDINNSFMSSTQIIWNNIISFLPTLILAILFLIAGLIVASLLGKLATKVTRGLKIDKLLATTGALEKLRESNISINISDVVGWLIKWFIIIATLLTVSSILNLNIVSEFLSDVLLYIPNVLIAVIILTIGLVVGNFVAELVEKSVAMSDFISRTSVKTLRTVTKWVIILFATMAALSQLKIAPQLIQIFFTGVVMMFTLAGGLAFGLAGKDEAKKIIDKISHNNPEE
jgi:hypothetical protein